jgi:hypothetical protein
VEGELAERAQAQIQQTLQNGPLAGLAKTLRGQIDAALHDDRQPATLGVVVRELESALDALGPAAGAAAESDPAAAAGVAKLDELQALHQGYRRFLGQQLDADGARKAWPLLALLFGLGLGPWLLGWVDAWFKALPPPPPGWARDAAQWLVGDAKAAGHPWAATLAALLAGAGLAYGLHRGVKREVLRARQFWTDPERGRLAAALRSLLDSLADDQAAWAARWQRDAASNIRAEAGRELGQWHERLRERRREIGWLRGQLHDFLDMHGLDAESPAENWTRISREGGIRHALEEYADLQRILQTNPPSPERFQSMQAESQPFKQWEERYSPAFLYPLRFIDELSDAYREPLELELAQPGGGGEQNARARELCAFLRRHSGDFATAFRWKAQDGVPPDAVYCLLPPLWLGLPGVRETLADQGISAEHRLPGADAARAYLLRLQIGVETACLTQ